MAKSNPGASCIVAPQINGENSELYLDIQKMVNDRPIGNLIYATYFQPDVISAMDKAGYGRNRQHQHNAKDVWSFLNMDAFMDNRKTSISKDERELGVVDNIGRRVYFTDGELAYQKAKSYNDSHPGRVASVYQHGDEFEISIVNADSMSQMRRGDINRYMACWDTAKAGLNEQGVDINFLKDVLPSLFTPANIQKGLSFVYRAQNASKDSLTIEDIKVLLAINQDLNFVQRIKNKYGDDINVQAEKIYDILHNISSPTDATKSFVSTAIDKMQNKDNLDIPKIINMVSDVDTQKYNAVEYRINHVIELLNKEYGIGLDVIYKTSDKIKSLSEAVQEQAVAKNRELSQTKKKKNYDETKALSLEKEVYDTLDDLKGGRYYESSLRFLKDANDYLAKIYSMLGNIDDRGSAIEIAANRSEAITKAKNFLNQYYNVINALSSPDIIYDQNLSKQSIESLRGVAKDVLNNIKNLESVVNGLVETTMVDAFTELLGDNEYCGKSIADIINIAMADSSSFDYLFSLSRVSNPLVAAINGVIRNANDKRDAMLNKYSDDIRRAARKFYKSNDIKNTYFMYDDNGYIVSNYDWKTFYEAKYKYQGLLRKRGEYGIGLQIAMKNWEANHTDEIVVDEESGRTERVPSINEFRKKIKDESGREVDAPDFMHDWNDAQKEYYNEIMKIKGKIGTLLPFYAQKQFIAPQVRKGTIDVLQDIANKKLTVKEGVRILLKNAKFWEIKEDDFHYGKNGIILNGEDVTEYEGSFDGTPLRHIPIFYINKLKDQNELLHDFSGGLQQLASTACNYSTLNEICDFIEVAADFVSNQTIARTSGVDIKKKAVEMLDGVSFNVAKVIKELAANTNTSSLLNAMIDRDIYGNKWSGSSTFSVIAQNIINYGTFKSLSTNVLGGVSNKLVGDVQNFIEAVTGEYFNIGDYVKARAYVVGNKFNVGKVWDYFTDSRHTLDGCLESFFDPVQEDFSEKSHHRYYKNPFAKMFGDFNSLALYGVGESMIHLTNMYAILFSEKVRNKEGKIVSLYDALTKKNNLDGTAELGVKDGYTRLDGSEINDEYLHNIKQTIRTVNQKCHGSMNVEDKGVIQRNVVGRAALNFRQWMVEHYSRRYRELHFEAMAGNVLDRNFFLKTNVLLNGEKIKLIDAFDRYDHEDGTFSLVLKDGVTKINGDKIEDADIEKMRKEANAKQHIQSGFYNDTFNWIKNWIKGAKTIDGESAAKWSNLEDRQKYNIIRCLCAELPITAMLFGISVAMGDDKDHKGDWLYKFVMYQVRRLLMDENASNPYGMFNEARSMLEQKIIPATQTVGDLLYPITGLVSGDIAKEQGSGRYKGENKYWYNIKRHTIPFWWDIQKLTYLGEDHTVFGIFDNTNYTR